MIGELRSTKSANFYHASRNLSNAAIDELFRNLRSSQPSVSQNIFLHRREHYAGAIWSAISFFYERKPSFFVQSTQARERVCGFMLLVEYSGYVAVFKSRLELPTTFISRFLSRINTDLVDSAIARGDAIFEKIKLRNMSVSKLAMRSKTIEAPDLANVVGPAGASRYVPQGYTVRAGQEHYSTTPNTGRISQRSDRIGHDFLIEYACSVIDALVTGAGTTSSFIRSFARSLDLASIEGYAQPAVITVDIAYLTDSLFEEPKVRFVRNENGGYVELLKADIDPILVELDAIFSLEGAGRVLNIISPGGNRVGGISVNKSRIALRTLDIPLIAAVEVEALDFAVGTDPGRLSLRRYLDKQDAFIVLFDQPSLAYIDGVLFRDESFTNGGGSFLRYLRTDAMLAGVTDEKGTFSATHTQFDADSTFGAVVQSIAVDDDFLVCDDLGDEWADFIGLCTSSNPPSVSFYHAKHGPISLGASPFHVSVSQAIKNLGRMTLMADAMPAKFARWKRTYNNNGSRTAISRIARGDVNQLEGVFELVRTAPDAIRRVFIVTSSLSKAAVEQTLDDIRNGHAPDPHFVQLYWLLMSFFSACTEVGAFGYVICQK